MEEKKLIELLRHAFQWGRGNGSNRSEKNFNDFLETQVVQQELRKFDYKEKSEQLVCEYCKDSVVEEQGDWCQECLNNPSRVITN